MVWLDRAVVVRWRWLLSEVCLFIHAQPPPAPRRAQVFHRFLALLMMRDTIDCLSNVVRSDSYQTLGG
jgi:hypothetical protein